MVWLHTGTIIFAYHHVTHGHNSLSGPAYDTNIPSFTLSCFLMCDVDDPHASPKEFRKVHDTLQECRLWVLI